MSTDTYDSRSPIEEREWSAGNPPLGHDDPVEPNPHRDDPDVPAEEPDEDEDDDDEAEDQPE